MKRFSRIISTAFSRTARTTAAPGAAGDIAARAEAERRQIHQMACDGEACLVDGARMAQQQIAVIHRQRQRPARLQFAGDQVVDIRTPIALSVAIGRMHVGEALVVHAVGREERLVELEQRHRSRPHREFTARDG